MCAIISGAAIAITGSVLIGLLNLPFLNFAYSAVSVITLNLVFFKCSSKSFIINDLILIIISVSIDMVSAVVLSAIISLDIEQILNDAGYKAAVMVMGWLLLFIAFRIFLYVVEKRKSSLVKTHELIFFLLLTVGESFFLNLLNSFFIQSQSHYELSVILILFVALDIYVAFLFNKISDAYQLQSELDLISQQSAFQLKAYKNLAYRYTMSRQTIHDIKNHIRAVEGLIDKNQFETAERYTKLMNDELDKLTPEFMCDNEILSVIINSKLQQARQMNIDFILDIQYSLLDFISEMDITTIFANILDNAFEACLECDERCRFVKLSLLRHNSFLLIYAENSYQNVSHSDGSFNSTKKGHQGIGLANIKKAVQKYDGIFAAEPKSDGFSVEITLTIP